MKNEKAMLVILAYLIGFQTAYIAFGLTNDRAMTVPGDIVEAVSVGEMVETIQKGLGVTELSDGLYATLGNQERLLSAQVIGATERTPGFHHEVISSAVSPDERFIHYCAAEVADTDQCANYIYEVASDTTYRVETEGGSNIDTALSNDAASWNDAGLLTVGSYISYNAEQPWWVMVK